MITITERRGGFGGFFTAKPRYKVPIKPGKPLRYYIPERFKKMDLVEVKHNHVRVERDFDLDTVVPGSGDTLTLLPIAGFISFIVGTLLAIAVKYAEYHVTSYQQNRQKLHEKRSALGPTYHLEVMQNEFRDGQSCPWVFGRTRTGGTVIQQYTDQFDEGIDRLNRLIVCSHGPIESVTKPHVNGNTMDNFRGATTAYTRGLNDQDPLTGFRDSNTTITGNDQLLDGAAVIVGGTASAERMKLKVYFPSGVYHDNTDGHHQSITWIAQIRYRTTAGPGAWQDIYYPNSTVPRSTVSQDSAAGQTTLYVYSSASLSVGDVVSIGYASPRWETKTIAAINDGNIVLTANLDYTHTADEGDYVHIAETLFRYKKRQTTPHSIWIPALFPSADTYDVEVTRRCPDQGGRDYYDAYLQEYQQISDDGLRYPGLATVGYQAIGNTQVSGQVGRFTHLVEGAITNPLSSTTLAGTPAFTRDPGALMLLLIYNQEQGLGTEIDPRVSLTMTATGAEYTVNEVVTGPTSDYQFRGTVYSWDGTTEKLVVEVENGFPHGNITGADSGKVAAVSSVDECWACDFPSLYNHTAFCAEQVPNGTLGTTVNGDSNSGQKVLQVADTDQILVPNASTTVDADSAAGQKVLNVTMVAPDIYDYFEIGDKVLVNSGGAREETCEIAAVAAWGQLVMVANLANAHTAVQADDVEKIHLSVCIDFEGTNAEVGTIDTVQGGVSITLEDNLTYTHLAASAAKVRSAENRAYFDYTWDGQETGWAAIERIAKCTRAMVFPNDGNYVKVVSLKEESLTDTQIVSMANVRRMKHPKDKGPGRSSFKIDFPEIGRRPNKLTVEYLDEDYDYRRRFCTVEIPEAVTAGEKIIHAKIELFGISRESQAAREAWFRLKMLYYSGNSIEWQMGQECLDFECGDVFQVQHDIGGYGTGSGRIKAGATTTSIPLDHPVTVAGGETLLIQHKSGTQESAAITNGAGTHPVLNVAGFAGTAQKGDAWALGTLARFRLVSMKMDQDLRAQLRATEDSTSLYTEDFGEIPSFTETTLPDPDEIPPDVTNLTLTEAKIIHPNRGLVSVIDVCFTRPEHGSTALAEVWFREMTTSRLMIGATGWAPGTGNLESHQPRGICSDGTYIYVCDELNHRVIKYNLDLSYVDEVGTIGTGNDNFISPIDCCTDGTYLFVLDAGNHRINTRLCANLNFDNAYGTQGAGNAQFEYPMGICTDDGNELWIADTFNHRIKRCTVAAGVPAFSAHVGAQGNGDAQFERPMGIDIDSGGNYIGVADTGNHRIKKHGAHAAMAYDSKIGSYHVDAGNDNFYWPMDVAIRGNWSRIYVADYAFNRIHERDGSDLSHVSITGGTTAGIGRDEFDGPRGLCHESTYENLLFVAERNNNRVQFREDGAVDMEDWILAGETSDNRYRITEGIAAGEEYEVSVAALSPNRTGKDPIDAPSETITTTGTGNAPPDVANVYATYHNRQFRVWWDSVQAPDLIGYEVRVGNDWQGGRIVHSPRLHQSSTPNPRITDITVPAPVSAQQVIFRVKAITTTNQESDTEATVTIDNPTVALIAVQPVVSTVNLRTG